MRHPVSETGESLRRVRRHGLSLIELLIVVSLLSIFSLAVMTRWEAGIYDQARAAAQVVASDVAFTRNLAVSNNSSYRLTFNVPGNRYVLTQVGTATALDTLDPTPYGQPTDAPHERTTDLSRLPAMGNVVRLFAVHRLMPTAQNTSEIEFGPLGELAGGAPVRIWISVGSGTSRRFLPVQVHPVTGLTEIGILQLNTPSASSGSPMAPMETPGGVG